VVGNTISLFAVVDDQLLEESADQERFGGRAVV
jgi:hypothetical protein